VYTIVICKDYIVYERRTEVPREQFSPAFAHRRNKNVSNTFCSS